MAAIFRTGRSLNKQTQTKQSSILNYVFNIHVPCPGESVIT